ncbi:MAG: TolC family outer membrane protein, partial [Gammaproteobacteria bacterium]|nr:TolC family outer membrane protein [Gammaproteobacteria bacterium]
TLTPACPGNHGIHGVIAMRYKFIIYYLAACLGLLIPGSALGESLHDVVSETISTNPDVQIARNQRNATEQEMEQARAGFFPTAEITVGNGVESSNNPTTRASGHGRRGFNRAESEILARQLLFDGFGTESEVDRQKARTNASAYTTFGTSETTALRAIDTYLDVLNELQLVKLAEDNLKYHEKIYSQILKRSERGVGRKSDTQQTLGRLALAQTNLITEENNLEDAIAAFLSVVGREPGTLEVPDTLEHLLPETMEDAIDIALDNHPTLKSAEADVVAARAQQKAAKSAFFPRVHLEVGGSRNDNIDGIEGSNRDAHLMLRGRYSFTGGRDLARREETAYLLSEAKEVRNRTRRQVIESMQLSWHAYERSKSALDSLKVHVDASVQASNAYRKQFSIGQRTLLDVLDSENELFTARIDYENGKRDFLFSIYRILAGTGKLLWALEVPVPAESSTIP